MFTIPSTKRILRTLLLFSLVLFYTGMALLCIVIALFFSSAPVGGRICVLAVAAICLVSLRFIINHLKELLKA